MMSRGHLNETGKFLVPRPPGHTTRTADQYSGRRCPEQTGYRDEPLHVAWRALAALPPRLMVCDAEGLPKHWRWFRVLRPNDGDTRATLTWGKNRDGRDQMSWKTCSSAPPKRRSVVSVSANDYPTFALGFEIQMDRGPPLKVNAPDSAAKAQWLAAFNALNEATRLCGTTDAQSTAIGGLNLDDDEEEDLIGTRPAERAEVSVAFVAPSP